MIEDTEDGSRGALIDWEFAARITSDDMYSAGGTVSALSPYLFGEQRMTNFSGNHTLYVHQRP